jgi:CRISPR locus-related DNA-binding protein
MKPGLRVHIATVGFQIRRITEPLVRERADKVYLITRSHEDKATAYLDKIIKILRKEKYLQIEKRAMDIWDLFDCLQTYKKIMKEEHNAHIYINVSTGSKVSSVAGTMACMIWKGTPYYAHIEYNDKKDPADDLPDEDVTAIDEIPVYSINQPKPESLVVLKILENSKGERPKTMKKGRLIEELEEAGIINRNLSIGAKHSKLKGLLNSISVAGSENPLVDVEYKGRQSNVMLTNQGESTLKIFGE